MSEKTYSVRYRVKRGFFDYGPHEDVIVVSAKNEFEAKKVAEKKLNQQGIKIDYMTGGIKSVTLIPENKRKY